MSSTEDPRIISNFYHNTLIPVATSLRGRKLLLFRLKADLGCSTYYVKRARTRVEPSDLEDGGCEGPEDLELKLEALWRTGGARDRGLTGWQTPAGEELARLAGPVAELAGKLCSVEEQDAEIPPFLYVMF